MRYIASVVGGTVRGDDFAYRREPSLSHSSTCKVDHHSVCSFASPALHLSSSFSLDPHYPSSCVVGFTSGFWAFLDLSDCAYDIVYLSFHTIPLRMDDEMDMDDLFGDGAGLALPSRPPSKELHQRLDELRTGGCCQ